MDPLKCNTEKGTWDEAITSWLANASISMSGFDRAAKNPSSLFKPGVHQLSGVEN